jgi:hypothetical protein
MKKEGVFAILAWLGFIGVPILLLYTCGKSDQRKKEINRQGAENEFNEFCTTNNATPGFKDLPKSNLLTIDLQRSLFVKKKRAAFKAQLVDVYRSRKRGTMTASFTVDHSDANIYVYLTCTESQAQTLHDIYQREKNATLLIAAEFEEVEPTAQPSPDSNSESASDKEAYSAIGTLVASKLPNQVVRSDSTSAVQDDD